MTTSPDSAVREFIAEHRPAFLDELAEWLRIPSVSADPGRAGEVRRSAEWLADRLRSTGFPVAEVWETDGDGLPAVFAEWPSGDPAAPTVLVYGHHDVQPAAREDGWATDPFEPVVVDGRMYARGAADDKGQVFFHTLGVRAHLAATGRTAPAVNLKLLVEGEEESGSPNFGALIRKHADRLAADVVMISDTGMWGERTPTVCTGMRGMVELQIDLTGPAQDIHSGSFGGAVPNPATEAARLVAGQDVEKVRQAVADWVAERLPAGIGHAITFTGTTRPCLTPLDHPALQSVVRSMGRAFEQKIRFTREGGSGPAADLQTVLGAPVLFLGISVPSDGWHSVNEKVELDLLAKGVETSAYLWGDLASNWNIGEMENA